MEPDWARLEPDWARLEPDWARLGQTGARLEGVCKWINMIYAANELCTEVALD